MLSRGPWLLATAALLLATRPTMAAIPPDPIDELRQELRASREGLRSRFPDLNRQLKGVEPDKERDILNAQREKVLLERVKALKTIPEMRRALLLNDWRLDETSETAAVDTKARLELIKQLETAVRKALSGGSASTRLAAVNTIAELGSSVRTLRDRFGVGHDFAADLANTIKNDPSPVVRAAATRAMGQILPDPKLAGQALNEALASPDVAIRRSAAAGLVAMVRLAAQLSTATPSAATGRLQLERTDVAAAGEAALRAAKRGLADSDSEVRVLCAEVFEQVGSALANTVPRPAATEDLGSPSLPSERAPRDPSDLRPLMDALRAEAPAFANALGDSETRVRLMIARGFEEIAQARDLLQRATGGAAPRAPAPSPRTGTQQEKSTSSIRPVASQNAPAASTNDPLLGALKPAIPALTRAVSDPSFEVRLRALEAMETIGLEASAASAALIRETRDPNLFVRWGAARALGKVALNHPKLAVPALARLLQDEDFDVNIAAARALDRFGADAVAALPELIKAITASDAEKRKEVLRTIQSIGPEAAPAIPAVIERLSDPDPAVRQAAADLLGRFGPAAVAAVPALRRALDDSDAEVRRAATDALLSIQP
ncbi:MAG TPA: HEAT repeat domain-containing protein [Gemmataceae bacterium]|nr:HEAT repeat domain-containing protein [Gemmataceae bacterium]